MLTAWTNILERAKEDSAKCAFSYFPMYMELFC